MVVLDQAVMGASRPQAGGRSGNEGFTISVVNDVTGANVNSLRNCDLGTNRAI